MPDAAPSGFPDPAHDHAPCLADMLSRAELAFENNGSRMTPLRRMVLQEVAGSHTAVGAYDVLDRLVRKGERRLAPISVYRALDSLVEVGMVHRLESRNAFFACHVSHAGDRRQIVLACDSCNTSSGRGCLPTCSRSIAKTCPWRISDCGTRWRCTAQTSPRNRTSWC